MGEYPAGVSGFVGRARELQVLRESLAAARRGTGELVLVTGEAGIGKTRLCKRVMVMARDSGFLVAWGSCWSEGGSPPLWPWQPVLAGLGDRDAAALFASDEGGTEVDPERFARFVAITDRLADACRDRPALVVVDDLHLADPGALLLTRFVARALARIPLLLLATCRTDVGAPGGFRWRAEDEALVVPLDRFDLSETEEFVRARGRWAERSDLVHALYRVTGGHPLHLQRAVALGRGGLGDTREPRGVRITIADAIDHLTLPARRLLSVAAVLGPSVELQEAAAVGEVPVAVVYSALAEAQPVGLASVDTPERFSFSHDLVREVLLDRLTPMERSEAHARVVDRLARHGPRTPDQLTRQAYHSVRAAPHSPARARLAVAACRAAAHALGAGFDYEQAAALLAEAVAGHEQAGLDTPLAPLLVEWAEAVLRCGRLAEARILFDRAASAAQAEQNVVLLARAALGLGGFWLNEHRTLLEWKRVTALQHVVLALLPFEETHLRHRLVVRLASEEVYRGGPVEPVLEAVKEARRLGDGRILAEALSLCHHALLTPGHTGARLPLAEELITVASPAGEGMLALVGLCWRTIDLFHLGDQRAVRSLAELRERADAVGCLSVLYVAESIEVMLLIRAGRLEEAEAKANRCFEMGTTQVGDADALGFFGAHLLTIRWLQGREAELPATMEEIADSPTLNPAEFGFRATVAAIAARTGHLDRARTMLDRLTAAGLAALPESSTWLAGMLAIVEAARPLGDRELAGQAYELLSPYAGLPIMPSMAVTCFGSTHRPLGLAALTLGDVVLAVTHLEAAVQANRLLGNRPFTAMAMAELAGALHSRSAPGDHERAVELLAAAAPEVGEMGMTALAAECAELQRVLTIREAMIVRRARHWVLTMGGHHAVVADRLGVGYLARLLTNPGRRITVLELAGGAGAASLSELGEQPVLDERGRAAYRRRVAELTRELEAAGERGDPPSVERLRAELDAVFDHLRQITGRGGRTRGFPDPRERARTAVQKAIKRAMAEIADAEPALGALLAQTVTTGSTCCYIPTASTPVRWAFRDER